MFFGKKKQKKDTAGRGKAKMSLLQRLIGGGNNSIELEKLEDELLQSDIGARASADLIDAVESASKRNASASQLQDICRNILLQKMRGAAPHIQDDVLNVFLILGVNGVGKTTSIAKLAQWYRSQKGVDGIVLAAGDTFRAAAVQQLVLHGERLGIRVVRQEQGSDSAAVVYDAVESALSRKERLLIVDTAGRMHNKANLVEELAKIHRIIERKAPDANINRIIVVDATTGQNAVRQAEVFRDAVGVDFAIVSKYDSSARAGSAVSLSADLQIPIAFFGTGERYEDIQEFSAGKYVDELLGIQ